MGTTKVLKKSSKRERTKYTQDQVSNELKSN